MSYEYQGTYVHKDMYNRRLKHGHRLYLQLGVGRWLYSRRWSRAKRRQWRRWEMLVHAKRAIRGKI